jgi:hypothetical protein
MLKIKPTSRYCALSLAIALVGCSGNNSSTTIGSTIKIDLDPVDKTLEADAWTVENYKSFAALGHSSLIDNLNTRSALLGYEQSLAVLLNLFSVNGTGTFACDIGHMVLSEEDASIRVVYTDCQLGETRYQGENWTNLSIACPDADNDVVTDTFILGYKNYTQKQKLDESTSYSQMYANGLYEFTSRSHLDVAKVSDNNICPKMSGIDSKVVLSPQAFIQIDAEGVETNISNASHEFQPSSNYVEYINLELFESVADSSIYNVSGSIAMNGLGSGITMSGSDFKYALNGKTTAGTLEFVDGNSKISLVFSPDSVEISLDLDTTDSTVDSNETIDQDDFGK